MRLTINIPDDIHRSLKIKAAKEGTTMHALLLQGIDDHLKSKIITVPTAIICRTILSRRSSVPCQDPGKRSA